MKNILISGATGFIGQRLVGAVDANIRVLSREKQPDYETVVCDFEKEDIPKSALELIDTVFHIAGFAHDIRDASKINALIKNQFKSVSLSLIICAFSKNLRRMKTF